MMRAAVGLGLILAVAVTATPAQDQGESHYGTFEYVSGKNSSGDIPKERLTGTIKVTEGMVQLLDEEGKEAFAISYTVDSEDAPHKISMKIERSVFEDAVGATAKGLAKTENGQVTLIYDFSENPKYPDGFEPKGQQHLFVLKKTADAK